jgi:hypothetical protein
MITSPIGSHTRTDECTSEHCNDMAIVEDSIREIEWGEQADTILVLVRFPRVI